MGSQVFSSFTFIDFIMSESGGNSDSDSEPWSSDPEPWADDSEEEPWSWGDLDDNYVEQIGVRRKREHPTKKEAQRLL